MQFYTIIFLHLSVSPPAAVASGPAPPRDALEALEQRRAKYVEASAQAKASGDDRKARMHDRIAKVKRHKSYSRLLDLFC